MNWSVMLAKDRPLLLLLLRVMLAWLPIVHGTRSARRRVWCRVPSVAASPLSARTTTGAGRSTVVAVVVLSRHDAGEIRPSISFGISLTSPVVHRLS